MEYRKYIIIILGHIFLLSCTFEKNEIDSRGFSENGIYGAFYNHKYKKIFAGNGMGELMVFDDKFELIDKKVLAKGPVSTCISSPDNEFMANTSADGTLYIWKVSKEGIKLNFHSDLHHGYSMTCMFSPKMNYLFSSGSDSSIVILDLETKTVLKRIKSDWGVIHFAWFSADEKYLLWGDSYGYLYKTDLVSWVSSKVRLDETAINCLVANEKMDEIIAVSDLGMLYILDFEKLSVSQRLIVSNSRAFVVEYLDIAENIIITSDENGEFKLYERNEDLFHLSSTISAHEGICCTIIYNDDKTKLLSGGQDGWIKEWSINDFRLINKIDTKGFE